MPSNWDLMPTGSGTNSAATSTGSVSATTLPAPTQGASRGPPASSSTADGTTAPMTSQPSARQCAPHGPGRLLSGATGWGPDSGVPDASESETRDGERHEYNNHQQAPHRRSDGRLRRLARTLPRCPACVRALGSRAAVAGRDRLPRLSGRARPGGARVAPVCRSPRVRGRMTGARTAFVLSGGASLGAVQPGMLRALYEQGITADLLVGTSAGALNAAFVASRPQTVQTARDLARIWRDLRRDDVFPVSMRALVGGLCRKRDHLVPDGALRRLVSRHCEFDDLADAPTPLHVVAYDVMAGREVLMSAGAAVDAATASASIPGVFPPVVVGDQVLIDGGVVNNTPISHAVALGAQRGYVLPPQARPRRIDRPPARPIDAAIHALTLLVDARFAADLARYAHEVELIVLPAPNSRCVQPTDFEHAGRLTAEALSACREALAARPALEVAA